VLVALEGERFSRYIPQTQVEMGRASGVQVNVTQAEVEAEVEAEVGAEVGGEALVPRIRSSQRRHSLVPLCGRIQMSLAPRRDVREVLHSQFCDHLPEIPV
jgi:hypothetical protein